MTSKLRVFALFYIPSALILLSLIFAPVAPANSSEAPPWTALTRNGLFQVTLGPQDGAVRINVMQNWVVTVLDKQGVGLDNVQVLLDGGMRAHGHGLPTKPQITQHLGGGSYLIEGLRLNMVGDWTLMIGVDQSGQRDIASFDIAIDY